MDYIILLDYCGLAFFIKFWWIYFTFWRSSKASSRPQQGHIKANKPMTLTKMQFEVVIQAPTKTGKKEES